MKLDVMMDYTRFIHEEETSNNVEALAGRIEQLKDRGRYMDMKDHTNEFSNLLSDMEDEDNDE